jgi:hypothetical protein
MSKVTRRFLISRGAAGFATLGLFGGAPHAAEAQLVWTTSEWKLANFEKVVNDPARIKQLYDVVQIGDGKFLNNVKNSFNGLRFGFGIPERQIKIAVALHGSADMLNYDDYVWENYQIGEWLKGDRFGNREARGEEPILRQQDFLETSACRQESGRSGFRLSGHEHASAAIEGSAVSELPYRPGRTGAGPQLPRQAIAIAGRYPEGHACAHCSRSPGSRVHGSGYCTSSRPKAITPTSPFSRDGARSRRSMVSPYRHRHEASRKRVSGSFNHRGWQHDCNHMVESAVTPRVLEIRVMLPRHDRRRP